MLIKIFQCCCLGVCDIVLLVRSVSRCGLHMTESWALDLRICVMVMDCHNHTPVLCTFRLWSLFLCVFFYVISAFGSHCSDRAYCFRMTYIFAHSSTIDCHFNFYFSFRQRGRVSKYGFKTRWAQEIERIFDAVFVGRSSRNVFIFFVFIHNVIFFLLAEISNELFFYTCVGMRYTTEIVCSSTKLVSSLQMNSTLNSNIINPRTYWCWTQ